MSDYARDFGRGGPGPKVEEDSLTCNIGLGRQGMQWRTEFVAFDCDDTQRLSDMAGVFETHADDVGEKYL